MSIYDDLAAVMSAVDHVAKRDRNNHQNFSFRGIDAVVNAVGPALREHGVIVVPYVREANYEQLQTSNGKATTSCRVIVDYTFYAKDGSCITTRVAAESFDSGDKATPKAMSVAFRTALLQALALPTDEPDPDSYTYEQDAKPAKPKPTQEQYDTWINALNTAESMDDLNAVGVEANTFDLTVRQREELRALFIARSKGLMAA